MGPLLSRDRLVDTAAFALCTAAGALSLSAEPPGGVLSHLGLILGAVALVIVFARRRAPVPFALVAIVAGQLTPLATWLPLLGVFTVAVHRRWPATVAVAVLAAGAGALRLSLTDDQAIRWALVGAATVLVVTATGWGMFVRARRELLESLRERADRAEADQEQRAEEARTAERRRIAREMHDVLGHRLSLISVHAGALELRSNQPQSELPAATVARTAGVLRVAAHAAMTDLREIVLVLREPTAPDGHQPDGPQPGLGDLDELVAQSRTAGVTVELTVAAEGAPEQLGRTVHRIVQEGLTNAQRHAPGAPVRVEVSGAAGAALSVRVSTGPATAPSTAPAGSGTGLIGLRERVELARGELTAGPRPDGSHQLEARLPWPA